MSFFSQLEVISNQCYYWLKLYWKYQKAQYLTMHFVHLNNGFNICLYENQLVIIRKRIEYNEKCNIAMIWEFLSLAYVWA